MSQWQKTVTSVSNGTNKAPHKKLSIYHLPLCKKETDTQHSYNLSVTLANYEPSIPPDFLSILYSSVLWHQTDEYCLTVFFEGDWFDWNNSNRIIDSRKQKLTCDGLSRGSSDTPTGFMLRKKGKAPTGWTSWLKRWLTHFKAELAARAAKPHT